MSQPQPTALTASPSQADRNSVFAALMIAGFLGVFVAAVASLLPDGAFVLVFQMAYIILILSPFVALIPALIIILLAFVGSRLPRTWISLHQTKFVGSVVLFMAGVVIFIILSPTFQTIMNRWGD